MIDHKHTIRLQEVVESTPYRGQWCSGCACTHYEPLSGSIDCLHCGHSSSDHTVPATRNVMFLVEDLAAGGELFGLLMHSGPFPEDLARFYFKQLIDGLEYLHDKGITHRDLKPENLVLDAHFQLKMVDFGLAAVHSQEKESDIQIPMMHSGVGSQPYSAPEVYYSRELFRGLGYQGGPADIWSCGVILFVMLTGRPPFLRPLAKTYGPNLRRCKHFANLLKGHGYGNMSDESRDFLTRIFQPSPEDRMTIREMKEHVWFSLPTPSEEKVFEVMEKKCNDVWLSQEKPQMVNVLAKIRQNLTQTPILRPMRPQDFPVPNLGGGSTPAGMLDFDAHSRDRDRNGDQIGLDHVGGMFPSSPLDEDLTPQLHSANTPSSGCLQNLIEELNSLPPLDSPLRPSDMMECIGGGAATTAASMSSSSLSSPSLSASFRTSNSVAAAGTAGNNHSKGDVAKQTSSSSSSSVSSSSNNNMEIETSEETRTSGSRGRVNEIQMERNERRRGSNEQNFITSSSSSSSSLSHIHSTHTTTTTTTTTPYEKMESKSNEGSREGSPPPPGAGTRMSLSSLSPSITPPLSSSPSLSSSSSTLTNNNNNNTQQERRRGECIKRTTSSFGAEEILDRLSVFLSHFSELNCEVNYATMLILVEGMYEDLPLSLSLSVLHKAEHASIIEFQKRSGGDDTFCTFIREAMNAL